MLDFPDFLCALINSLTNNESKDCVLKKLARIFLVVAVVAFVLSLTSPGSDIAWGVLTPLSAVLMIAFFITNLLADEYAKYDQEQKEKLALAARRPVRSPALTQSRRDVENKTLASVTVP